MSSSLIPLFLWTLFSSAIFIMILNSYLDAKNRRRKRNRLMQLNWLPRSHQCILFSIRLLMNMAIQFPLEIRTVPLVSQLDLREDLKSERSAPRWVPVKPNKGMGVWLRDQLKRSSTFLLIQLSIWIPPLRWLIKFVNCSMKMEPLRWVQLTSQSSTILGVAMGRYVGMLLFSSKWEVLALRFMLVELSLPR
jgi:hypothetical protein